MPQRWADAMPDEAAGEVSRSAPLVRVRGADAAECHDLVAHEEPLEIQVQGAALAVVMRTPGHDAELARGFLVTERVIRTPDDILAVRHHGEARSPDAVENVIGVALEPEVPLDLDALRRNLYASSSCGVCGKATLENALATAPPLDDPTRITRERLVGLVPQLETAQAGFAETGGLHAAALFGATGVLRVCREDVGRHNAVDKTVGHALVEGPWPLAGHSLLVSGRISFEIVQKALAARIPIVAGISAPTSLAVALAARAGILVVGFLRDDGFNAYGATARLVEGTLS